MSARGRYLTVLVVLFAAVLAWSAIHPHDYFTWFLEVFPALIAFLILAFTYNRFPLTPLVYTLILIHASILMMGGHYTYALTPLGEWMKEAFHFARNHYDRIGHFAQGFVPAIVAREVLLRTSPLRNGRWLRFLVMCVCLAISAGYELFEWRVAAWQGARADDFLGTQGDPWDTQEDMSFALIGAATALLTLERFHDRQLNRLAASPHPWGQPMALILRPAVSAGDIASVRTLFLEYAGSLGFNLCFQSFDKELAGLPGMYAPPAGTILLAEWEGALAGCVALHPLEDGICEMKRLYVRPGFRGHEIGRSLAQAVIAEACRLHYRAMRLDTVPSVMGAAVRLYRALGFREVPAYCVNPVEGAIFMELEL